MTPSSLENWFSDLMGEILLVIIFEESINNVESSQRLHNEKTEHGFQRLRDIITKFKNGNNH